MDRAILSGVDEVAHSQGMIYPNSRYTTPLSPLSGTHGDSETST